MAVCLPSETIKNEHSEQQKGVTMKFLSILSIKLRILEIILAGKISGTILNKFFNLTLYSIPFLGLLLAVGFAASWLADQLLSVVNCHSSPILLSSNI